MPETLAFLGSSIGFGELAVVFLAVLILFGPRRLPEIARSIGKALEQLRHASQEFKDQVMNIEQEITREEPPDLMPDSPKVEPPAVPPAGQPSAAPSAPPAEPKPPAKGEPRDDSAGR